jgi:hypothetical protein
LFHNIADPAVGGVDKPLTRTLLKNMLKRADRYATVATTPSRNATVDRTGLVTFHTYAVISFKGGMVKLYNTLASIGAREPEIAFDDFWKAFDGVCQARRHSACGRNRGGARRDRQTMSGGRVVTRHFAAVAWPFPIGVGVAVFARSMG